MQILVPLWPAIIACFGLLTSIVGIVVYAFSTFERRADAAEKHQSHDKRLILLEGMSRDISYIRGKIEGVR